MVCALQANIANDERLFVFGLCHFNMTGQISPLPTPALMQQSLPHLWCNSAHPNASSTQGTRHSTPSKQTQSACVCVCARVCENDWKDFKKSAVHKLELYPASEMQTMCHGKNKWQQSRPLHDINMAKSNAYIETCVRKNWYTQTHKVLNVENQNYPESKAVTNSGLPQKRQSRCPWIDCGS